jgi:magnesium-transporting ATPase (P-type)
MEGALVALAGKAGMEPAGTRKQFPRIDEIPFDSAHRFMATLHHRHEDGDFVVIKGAPERVLSMCQHQRTSRGDCPIDAAAWLARAHALAERGQRVLAVAVKRHSPRKPGLSFDDVQSGATLLGIAGFIDPPREEAVAAVAECRNAGIGVVMITGDHAVTAREVARQLGLAPQPRVLSGDELDRLDGTELHRAAKQTDVFARTSPEHKLRLVEAMQANGAVVAMTGDGVNDAPALKRADVGVAMGRKGTEAAKEASEMVLANDDFASIVAAVREGRTVYDNLRKTIAYTLPTNGGEALTILAAVGLGLTLPITPVQILWVNMVTAVALGLALAFEPTEPGTMRRPPRPVGEPILSGDLVWRIVFVSLLFAAGAFGVFYWAQFRGLPLDTARTMVVNTLVVMEIFYLFSVRYVHGTSLTLQGVLGTPPVLAGVTGLVVAQFAYTYAPFMQAVFHSAAVSVSDGLVIVAVGVALLVVAETEKRLRRLLAGGH